MREQTRITKTDWDVKAEQNNRAANSTYINAHTTLKIDARGDRISFFMEEYRPETNRSSYASITVSRDEWNQIKELIKQTNGEL